MSNYLKAGKGLKNMFIATVGAIICQVLLVIPFPFVNSIAMDCNYGIHHSEPDGLWTELVRTLRNAKRLWFTILGWW